MIKTFTVTTALVSAVAISGAANAGGGSYSNAQAKAMPAKAKAHKVGGLDVTLGGVIDFQAGFADQDQDATGTVGGRDYKFQNDTEIHVGVEGKSDNGLVYGAVIELEADISGDADGEGTNADKTFIYLESEAGRVELGGNSGVEETLKVDASSIARATGGIDGDFYDFVDVSGALVRPDLPLQDARGVAEDATKISYYTPRFSGFQAGVSYTPDSGNGGTAAGFTTDTDAGQFEDIFHLGANYTGEMEGVGLEVAATGTFGSAEAAGTEDLEAWNIGAAVDFEGFSLAGSYGDWQESGLAVGSNADSDYWTLGAAYETGPFGVSVTYLDSESGTTDFNNIVVGADYALAPGLTPYIEVSFFDKDVAGTALDNEGSVVLVGTELNF